MKDENKTLFATVVWFKKGFGFAKPDDGSKDIFIHYSDIVMADSSAYRTLQKDQRISYEIGMNLRNQPKAINVQVIDKPLK